MDARGLVDPEFIFTGPCTLVECLRDPLFKNPGIWIALGPFPDYPTLEVKAAKDDMFKHFWSCLKPDGIGGFHWAWEDRSDPSPTYVAGLAMKQYWTLAPALESALAQRLLPHRPMVEGLRVRRPRA
jgi:hypothetical protein